MMKALNYEFVREIVNSSQAGAIVRRNDGISSETCINYTKTAESLSCFSVYRKFWNQSLFLIDTSTLAIKNNYEK